MNAMKIAGHTCGAIAIILFLCSYQFKDKRKLLIIQSVATGMNCLQFMFLGAYSGLTINVIAIIRNLIYSFRDKNKLCGAKWMPYAIAALMTVITAFAWDGWFSAFIIVGIAFNTVALGVFDSQRIRWSILVSCPLILLYDVFTGAWTGVLNEAISIASSIVGIVRYRRSN